jgi:hypothetical protein
MGIGLVAVVLTLLLPGMTAEVDGVFYDSGVRSKLPRDAAGILNAFEKQRSMLGQSVNSLQTELDSINDKKQQKDFDFYLHLLEERHQELADLRPPIFVIGFFLSPQMLLWPAIYTSLGCLLFASRQNMPRFSREDFLRLLWIGLFVYGYYEWPLWVRNFLLGQHGRTVFAYTNFDIDPKSFVIQEGTIAAFAFLLSAVWLKWSRIAKEVEEQNSAAAIGLDDYLNSRFVLQLQRAFYSWIVNSIALGLGFAYFTTFFWNLVAQYHDQRYILSAFLSHSLWAATWVFLSIPLAKNWICLKEKRLAAIEALTTVSKAIPGKSEELNVERLEKLESLAGIRISVAGVGAVISLLLPIIQLFIHKG